MHPTGNSKFLMVLWCVLALAALAGAQAGDGGKPPSASPPPQPGSSAPDDENPYPAGVAPRVLLRNLAEDQRVIWTSPFKARIQDLNWLVPFAGLTAGLINADAELSSRVNTNGTFSKHSSTISNGGVALAVGGTGSLYLLGKLRSDEHQKETGILAGEAAVNSLIVVEAIKAITRRSRPNESDGQGKFGSGTSLNSSFPSMHAALAWSAATVLTHEYPGVMTKILGYGLASTVSLARVTGKDHFPSDVVVGSALGWMIGEQVYGTHHNSELPGEGYGTFHRGLAEEFPGWQSKASPYVPMDSWVYPAIDRLTALGVVHSGIVGLRPWTRHECARILEEAQADSSIDPSAPDAGEASRLYAALAREFASEMEGPEKEYLSLDSVYTRITGISGKPLTDGYHFGQTIVNDYGRPYEQGVNGLAGFSTSGSSGPLGFYVRGEFVHAPSAPGVSQAVQNAINLGDEKTTTAADVGQPIFQPATPIASISTFRLLDSYIMLNVNGWQASFGKQTLWTGPTQDPFLWSNNAEPMYMFRVDQTNPTKLPSFLGFLGPMRSEFWVGKLTGQHYISNENGTIFVAQGRTLSRQPMVNGLKVNFKPTPNFEFGVGRTGLWGGPEFPITVRTTRRSFLSTTNAAAGFDPGDRRSTADFSYRIPGLRNWLTLYEDSFVEDEISPIGYPRRAAHNPGLYLSHIPGLPHMDLRTEAAFTNLPNLREPPTGGFFYWNVRYLDGYTNQGNIIGNGTVGRQGIALRADTTYWFASDKTLQLGYRSNIVDSFFLQGGNLRDVHLKSEWSFGPKVSLSAFMQYEWWNFPLLTAGNKQNDFTASFQLTYWPHWRIKRGN
ncbi:MAG TPA: capsule assembly Wzi family protein [Candidatus Angelobacter sp.]|nr:capsule assembly Wzi family protein [Candidatus Angelobacter sp.]